MRPEPIHPAPRRRQSAPARFAGSAGIIAVLLVACLASATAARDDAEQPIEIEADRMTLDEAGGTTEYRGAVRLTQGSIEVRTERLTLHSRNGRLERMEIAGTAEQPAVFEQQTDTGGLARGRARHMEYNAADARLTLQGQAELRQGPNHIRSERIEYNTRTNDLLADGGEGQKDNADGEDERVRITIESNQEQDGEQE